MPSLLRRSCLGCLCVGDDACLAALLRAQILDTHLPGGYLEKEELDLRSVIRKRWAQLSQLGEDVSDRLAGVQNTFKRQLAKDVKDFVKVRVVARRPASCVGVVLLPRGGSSVLRNPSANFAVAPQDVQAFRIEFDTAGPTAPNIPAHIAMERLSFSKDQFENLERKMMSYSAGEELFGLRPTQYPELAQTKRDLQLCETLYKLFDEVSKVQVSVRNMLWRYEMMCPHVLLAPCDE